MLRVVLALLFLTLFPAAPLHAVIFTVTTTSDGADGACDAQCSLRDAVIAANTDDDADVILVPAGTYVLGGAGNEDGAASGDLDLSNSVTITGAGASVTVLDGGGTDRLIDIVDDATVTITGVTLRNGHPPAGDTQGGGAILWYEPVSGKQLDLRLDGVIVTGNSAGDGDGGGIKVDQDAPASSQVTIANSTISGNTMDDGDGGGVYLCCENLTVTITGTTIADNVAVEDPNLMGLSGEGGGIYHCCADTELTITDSTIRDNAGPTQGGGIYACCGVTLNTRLTLERATVSGNTALGTGASQGNGGGIQDEGDLTIVNTTVSGNRAFRDGGGIGNRGALVMRNVTCAANEATRGGGFYEDGRDEIATILANVLFADNLVSPGVAGNCGVAPGTEPLVSEGGNLSSDGTCPLVGPGDQSGIDAEIAPLDDYGGPTSTHALPQSSPAVDAGNDVVCQALDQRGAARPVDGDNDGNARCDVGAFERGSIVEDCDNGMDDNANGLVDCFDYDCTGQPLCAERCDNCVDDDGDGAIDRADADCPPRSDGGGANVADPDERGKPVVACAVALQKSGAKVTRGRSKTLQTCLAGLASCVQRKAGDPTCLARAGTACGKGLAKLDALTTKARTSIAKRCDDLTLDELGLASGLGYAAEATPCADLGIPSLDGLAAIASCVLAQHRCAVERLVALETPRAGELLALGGLIPTDVFTCGAVPTTGNGIGLGVRGKLLDACDRTRQKAGAKLVAGTSSLVGGCAKHVLACRQEKPADPACVTKAQKACAKSAAKLARLDATLGATIAKKCAAPKVAAAELLGAAGASFQSQASLCKAIGVPSLSGADAITACVFRHHRCRVQQMLERELPRLDELLTAGGVVFP